MKFDKYVEHAQWVFNHITKLESGCWQWTGKANKLGIHRIVADLCGMRYPIGVTVYHMPECVLGDACVNPEHVGTREEWNHVVKQALAPKISMEPPFRQVVVVPTNRYPKSWNVPFGDLIAESGQVGRYSPQISAQDHRFLKSLKIIWCGDNRDEY